MKAVSFVSMDSYTGQELSFMMLLRCFPWCRTGLCYREYQLIPILLLFWHPTHPSPSYMFHPISATPDYSCGILLSLQHPVFPPSSWSAVQTLYSLYVLLSPSWPASYHSAIYVFSKHVLISNNVVGYC